MKFLIMQFDPFASFFLHLWPKYGRIVVLLLKSETAESLYQTLPSQQIFEKSNLLRKSSFTFILPSKAC